MTPHHVELVDAYRVAWQHAIERAERTGLARHREAAVYEAVALGSAIRSTGAPVCAWCMPDRRWPRSVSHGICEEHAREVAESV